tara:strand:- start:209 stop:1204 length:996 start_codon:yes stop_codon:yes gene_type:complete
MHIFRNTLLLCLMLFSLIGHAVEFKIATVSPDGSVWMKELRAAAQEIAQKTGNRVRLKFYPGGVMGDDYAVLRKMRIGQLHGAVMTMGPLVQVTEDVQLYGLPMQFQSFSEVDHVRMVMDDRIIDALEFAGYITFGISEVGFAYAMSKEKVLAVDEVQSKRVWVPSGDKGSTDMLTAFGISPIPLTIADVLSGLQTGLINGVTVPPVAAIALQWHTQLEHVLDMPLLYVYGTFVINAKQFHRISEEDQSLVREILSRTTRNVGSRNREDHIKAVAALKNQGIQWNDQTPERWEQWQSHADRASNALVEDGYVSAQLYDELVILLEDFREQN